MLCLLVVLSLLSIYSLGLKLSRRRCLPYIGMPESPGDKEDDSSRCYIVFPLS